MVAPPQSCRPRRTATPSSAAARTSCRSSSPCARTASYFPVWAELVSEIQMNRLPEYVDAGEDPGDGDIRRQREDVAPAAPLPEGAPQARFCRRGRLFLSPLDARFRGYAFPGGHMLRAACPCRSLRQVGLPETAREAPRRSPRRLADHRRYRDCPGLKEEFFNGSLEAVINEDLKPTGLTVERLKNADGCMVASPSADPAEDQSKYELGMLRADGKPGFDTPTGKVEVYSTILKKHGIDPLPTYKEPLESPVSDPRMAQRYPLVLMTGARVPFYTHTKWRDVPWVSEFSRSRWSTLTRRTQAQGGSRRATRSLSRTAHGHIIGPGPSYGHGDGRHGRCISRVGQAGREYDADPGFRPHIRVSRRTSRRSAT